MKKLQAFVAVAALAISGATGAVAEETIKPLEAVKSTQTSLALGGLGAGAGATALIIGAVVTIVVVSSTSGT